MSEWTYRRIRDLLETSYAGEWGAPPSPGNARVLRATDIDSDGRINGQGALRKISPAIVQTKRLQRGDIMLEASGGSPEKPVGRVAFFFNEGGELPFLTSNFYKALRPASGVEPRFLHWALLRFYRQPDILQFQQQTTGIINLKFQDYLDAKIYAPVAQNEQKLIVHILDTLDTQIQKTEALIAKLEKVKEGLLHDLLTRGIDENGRLRPSPEQAPELYQESPLGLIPREWKIKTIGHLSSSIVDGPFGSNLKTEHYITVPGIRVIRLQNITPFDYDDSDCAFIKNDHAALLSKNTVNPGDLLVASLGDGTHPAGRACLYPSGLPKAINKADCFRLRPNKNLATNNYLMLFMNSDIFAKQSRKWTQGVTLQRVNTTSLKQIIVSCPPLGEQKIISQRINKSLNLLSTQKEELDKLKSKKQGLMDDLLTGRVRVTPLLEQVQATTPA
ncbi:restriction endonuclease subunit S [Halomonas sp. BN3-1]|uniref:restriction endonuclease subunit S n=1 Tax=Halomonas sp. BN3-1 TaxID=2082393 RepID=UPI000D3BC16F|nr:restriction endonuclease subunit S [Halomonas sp. BN3-1]